MSLAIEWGPRIKISIITDISILRFYRYIRYIINISMDILTQNIDRPKSDQKSRKCKKQKKKKNLLDISLEV